MRITSGGEWNSERVKRDAYPLTLSAGVSFGYLCDRAAQLKSLPNRRQYPTCYPSRPLRKGAALIICAGDFP